MPDPMPHFKYRYVNISHRHIPCIVAGGKVIHEIQNLDEFYGMFGYTSEISKAGLLPDEFIWSAYINNVAADFAPCIQIHIMRYLMKHSAPFKMEYGARCEELMATHADMRVVRGGDCHACAMKSCQIK